MTLGRPRATATVRIVDGLYLYGDQAYTWSEWREAERIRAAERAGKVRRRASLHYCEWPCPVLTPRPLCWFHLASRAREWDNLPDGSGVQSHILSRDASLTATTPTAGVVASFEVVAR